MGLAGYGPVPEPGYYFKIYAKSYPGILEYQGNLRNCKNMSTGYFLSTSKYSSIDPSGSAYDLPGYPGSRNCKNMMSVENGRLEDATSAPNGMR